MNVSHVITDKRQNLIVLLKVMFIGTHYYFVFLCFYFLCQASSDVCQLRLDFQTFSGFAVTTAGVKTDSMAAAGQTGKNPPTISGTNTGYHSKIFFNQLE